MRRGFTLIELLVVVAIIAILAAIAVPNFLEAQTRAKVSRVKSDLRTIATAIESYTVDWSRVPYDGEPGGPHGGWVNSFRQITTPVAYLTITPRDVFQDTTFPDTELPGHTHFLGHPDKKNHSYDYGSAYWHDPQPLPPGVRGYFKNFKYSLWKVGSAGPDLRFDNGGSWYGMDEIYDPTNGTVSDGDIYRSMLGQH